MALLVTTIIYCPECLMVTSNQFDIGLTIRYVISTETLLKLRVLLSHEENRARYPVALLTRVWV